MILEVRTNVTNNDIILLQQLEEFVAYLKERDREGSTDVVITWCSVGNSDQKTEKQQHAINISC